VAHRVPVDRRPMLESPILRYPLGPPRLDDLRNHGRVRHPLLAVEVGEVLALWHAPIPLEHCLALPVWQPAQAGFVLGAEVRVVLEQRRQIAELPAQMLELAGKLLLATRHRPQLLDPLHTYPSWVRAAQEAAAIDPRPAQPKEDQILEHIALVFRKLFDGNVAELGRFVADRVSQVAQCDHASTKFRSQKKAKSVPISSLDLAEPCGKLVLDL